MYSVTNMLDFMSLFFVIYSATESTMPSTYKHHFNSIENAHLLVINIQVNTKLLSQGSKWDSMGRYGIPALLWPA